MTLQSSTWWRRAGATDCGAWSACPVPPHCSVRGRCRRPPSSCFHLLTITSLYSASYGGCERDTTRPRSLARETLSSKPCPILVSEKNEKNQHPNVHQLLRLIRPVKETCMFYRNSTSYWSKAPRPHPLAPRLVSDIFRVRTRPI